MRKKTKRMKRTLSILLALAMAMAAGLSHAETRTVRPLELTQEDLDLANGEFWFDMDEIEDPENGILNLTLYLEDRYSLAEIESLRPGDTVEVEGEIYTVDLVVIHGWYDKDGDGEFDTGSTTVRDPEQVRELIEKYELELTEEELYPSSYEIYTREEFDGYIAFTVGSDGFCYPLVNDMTFRTLVGEVKISLPLPEGFVCHIHDEFGGESIENGTAQDFLDAAVYGCDRYSSVARFEDGKLIEIWIDE